MSYNPTRALEEAAVSSRFQSIYLYGSITIGGFDEHTGDIDVIALTYGDLTASDLAKLEALHKHLARQPEYSCPVERLDVIYIPLRDRGKRNSGVAPYPYARRESSTQRGTLT